MRKRCIPAALAAILLTPSGLYAQSNPDARVTLRVEGRALIEVVDYLREQSGANIVVMETGDTPIGDVPVSMELSLIHISEPTRPY